MYYGKDGYWKKVQEYLPEENRLTGVGGRMSILWE